jgi:hypothetical protein
MLLNPAPCGAMITAAFENNVRISTYESRLQCDNEIDERVLIMKLTITCVFGIEESLRSRKLNGG